MAEKIAYPGVYIEEIPQRPKAIEGVSTSIAAFIGRTTGGAENVAAHCQSYQDFVDAFVGAHSQSELAESVNLFFENGGIECYIVRRKDGSPDVSAALAALDKIDIINLIVIPPDTGISEDNQRTALIAASEYCFQRRAFLIADAPQSWTGDIDKFPVETFRERLRA